MLEVLFLSSDCTGLINCRRSFSELTYRDSASILLLLSFKLFNEHVSFKIFTVVRLTSSLFTVGMTTDGDLTWGTLRCLSNSPLKALDLSAVGL
jgi:hypothetical protein